MTVVLWAAMGITIGSAVLHGVLGLRRPLDRVHTTFAAVMVLVTVFLYFQHRFYAATTVEASVGAVRAQFVVIAGFSACLLVFVPAYTRVQLPRALLLAYWIGLIVLLVANVRAPYSMWYGARPELVESMFRGEPYHTVIAQRMGPAQLAYALYVTSLLLVAIGCAVVMYRRGERRRGATFAIALGLVLVHSVADIVRDNVGGSWPYVAEFGVVAWGLIMSMQLAHDYRAQARALADAIARMEAQVERLTAILTSLRALERNMSAPLQTLETGVAALGDGVAAEDVQLGRLRRAVIRLREFAHSMPLVGPGARTAAPR